MGKKKELWMKGAFAKHKEGSLHKQLEVPAEKKIPKSLLARIASAKQGSRIKNPTKIGKRKITVTGLLKKRVNPVITANYPELRKRR
jgi:hypothetical protein